MDAAIELRGLTKRYGATVGVEDVNLRLAPGEVVGFLGPNGAGKTTTIRCLVGLLRPTGGTVRVLGLDPRADHRALAARLGYLPGELRLYPELSGRRHLALLADLQGARAVRQDELCQRLALTPAELARPVATYSRGMKQKVGLVQAFQHDPEVLVLDEPTEGLDPLVQETFFALLEETRGAGRTVFLSSHVLSEVQRACSRVAIVRAGRLVAVDEVDALREARARRVRLTFAAGSDPTEVPVPDGVPATWEGDDLHLVLDGAEVVPTLRRLLALAVEDVVVEEASLDEAVLAFYRPDRPEQP